jgi:hypothetical protein
VAWGAGAGGQNDEERDENVEKEVEVSSGNVKW